MHRTFNATICIDQETHIEMLGGSSGVLHLTDTEIQFEHTLRVLHTAPIDDVELEADAPRYYCVSHGRFSAYVSEETFNIITHRVAPAPELDWDW